MNELADFLDISFEAGIPGRIIFVHPNVAKRLGLIAGALIHKGRQYTVQISDWSDPSSKLFLVDL